MYFCATTTANVVSYNNTGLTADQTYYYRVRAFNAAGNSGYSNTDYAITYSAVPNAPSNLVATASSTSIILTWTDNSTNEDAFEVERQTATSWLLIAVKSLNTTTHTDGGLAPGTYTYRVRAVNIIGSFGYSNEASVTIP